jgi:putative transferase (TIGR04331 family)
MDQQGAITLVLGRMPRHASPEDHWAAGPWCFAEQEELFPDWGSRFVFAPEPLSDIVLQERACRQVKALTASVLPAVAAHLCSHSARLPLAYWETLLTPWVAKVAIQIVERWWRVKAMCQAWGKQRLHLALLPEDCSFSFATPADFIRYGALGHSYNHWLLSRLLEECLPSAWSSSMLAPVHEEHLAVKPARVVDRLRSLLVRAMLMLPFPRLKGFSLGQSLRFSLGLLHKSHGEDHSCPQAYYAGHAGDEALDLPGKFAADPLPLFLAHIPGSLRRLRHPAKLSPDPLGPRLRVASVQAYEDSSYLQTLARWRGRGNRLMYVQHGSGYGQSRCLSDVELVEYSQHAFATWGWRKHSACRGNFIPLPHPQLARAHDLWQGQDGSSLLLVGTEMPLFGYRLDAHPTPLQMLEYRKDKARFLAALDRQLHSSILYRPYFPLPGSLRDADWLMERFPHIRLASGPLAAHLASCRLLVLDHNGTTLLEAMAANIPTILFWRRDFWPLTAEAESLVEILAEAGIWHETPAQAAARVAEIWADPFSWWMRDSVQEARLAYSRAQAHTVPDNPASYWIQTLKSL